MNLADLNWEQGKKNTIIKDSKEFEQTSLIRVFSFQKEPVIVALMKDGVYQLDLSKDEIAKNIHKSNIRRSDKTVFYQNQLSLDKNIYPMYTFFRLGGAQPAGISAFSHQWASLMGYYKLGKTGYILEMLIPREEGIVGELDILKVHKDFNPTYYDAEFVVRHFKKEWVREIYSFDSTANTYATRTITPLLCCNQDALIQKPMKVSGDGYAEKDYSQFVHSKPIVGLSYLDNISRLPSTQVSALLSELLSLYHFNSEIPKDCNDTVSKIEYVYNLIKDKIYTIYNGK